MLQYCKCGKEKKKKVNGRYMGYCGDSKCSPRYGIKRPDHSAKMKDLAASGENEKYSNSLMKKGTIFNKEANTIEFKMKVLRNKGIECDETNAEDLHSAFLASNAKSRVIRTKQILTKYGSWDECFKSLAHACCETDCIDDNWVSLLSDDEFSVFFKTMHGIQTVVNMEKHRLAGRNKHYIRVLMGDLKHNVRGITSVLTRSKLESSYIKVFEDNCIPWDYEWIRIPKTNGGTYSPDFYIKYQGIKYIIEVKGDWYEDDKDVYYQNCLVPAIKYANEHGMLMALSYVEPKNMKFLQKLEILNNIKDNK